ncbi:LysR family transcriptional regulator [Microvirga rosea]|uniref:LysR family transcriptional regulator n=1 Tax=Microvirga rosea TaxID=2715425 RepID=UPI001D0AE332|nr:LysR family transcriptional regulator [Microvirga rosea]MCB8820534.1 LysR family transcriptional regulator [Microvirga rosea]
MTLSPRHIEIFHAVMLSGSVTQAAIALRTSQPTVSREIKEFERSLGFLLFTRKGRSLVPTEAAISLHGEVRRSFVGLEEIGRTAEAIRANASSHIKIVCMPAYSTALLPSLCRGFLQNNEAIRLSIHALGNSVLSAGASAQHYDICLIEADLGFAGWSSTSINAGEQVCIAPKGHPLTRKSILGPADFEGVDFIYFSAEDMYRRKLDNVFREHGVTRRLRMEVSTAAAVCSLVAQGLGVSIINPISAAHCLNQGVEMRRLSFSIPYIVRLHRNQSTGNPRSLNTFADQCVEAIMNIRRQVQDGLALHAEVLPAM